MLIKADIEQVDESAVRLIGTDWMLITAGSSEHFNTMTAAWGGLGYLWHKPVAYIFIRPPRYTFEFTEKSPYFSLSFFGDEWKEQLQFCGTNSGRDVDKVKETGLEPLDFEGKTMYFSQARIVLICRKLYSQDLKPELFLDENIHKVYPLKDYHRMYIGEIETTLVEKK